MKLKRQCDKEEKAPTPENISYKSCTCPLSQKVPNREWDFYLDQHYLRDLYIELGKTDAEGTESLQKDLVKAEKWANEAERLENQRKREYSSSISVDPDQFSIQDSDEDIPPDSESDSEFEEAIVAKRNKWDYPSTTSFAMRHGLSNYQTMGMINNVLRDLSVLDQTKYVSRKKVRNMKENVEKNLLKIILKMLDTNQLHLMGKRITTFRSTATQI